MKEKYLSHILTFLSSLSYSIIAPIYPAEAVRIGVPRSVIGVVVCGYSLAMVMSGPVSHKIR